MYQRWWIFSLVLGLFMPLEEAVASPPTPSHFQTQRQERIHPKVAALVEGNSLFAFNLYKQLQPQGGNLLFSPYSISTALAMPTAGAKGETANQMLKTLHYPAYAYESIGALTEQLVCSTCQGNQVPHVFIANGMWMQKDFPLLYTFEKMMKDNFRSTIERVDFVQEPHEAVKKINQWVEEATKGKIGKLFSVQDVTVDTRLVLVSAIYLKAQWMQLFDKALTTQEPFFSDENNKMPVAMMKKTKHMPLYIDRNVAVLELSYANEAKQGPDLAFIIALPRERFKLAQIEKELSLSKWRAWTEQMRVRKVQLSLPAFRLKTRLDLNEALQKMGMPLAFTQRANFAGITHKPLLSISKVIHQTFMSVDEQGTEAAAATGIGMELTSMPDTHEEVFSFIADHPFIFAIIDKKTKSILFMGRFVQP
jgi:serpin B